MKKKAQRATSNVFSMFDQKQVQEFKEVRLPIDGGVPSVFSPR